MEVCRSGEEEENYLVIINIHESNGELWFQVLEAQQWRSGAAGHKLEERGGGRGEGRRSGEERGGEGGRGGEEMQHYCPLLLHSCMPFTLRKSPFSSLLKSLRRMSQSHRTTR